MQVWDRVGVPAGRPQRRIVDAHNVRACAVRGEADRVRVRCLRHLRMGRGRRERVVRHGT
eukprot:360919-Chlamydomonas_euryale.AAC.10